MRQEQFVRVYYVYVRINYANIMIGDIKVHKFNQIDLGASRIICFYEDRVIFGRDAISGYWGYLHIANDCIFNRRKF